MRYETQHYRSGEDDSGREPIAILIAREHAWLLNSRSNPVKVEMQVTYKMPVKRLDDYIGFPSNE